MREEKKKEKQICPDLVALTGHLQGDSNMVGLAPNLVMSLL
jgi:hypothetical protein